MFEDNRSRGSCGLPTLFQCQMQRQVLHSDLKREALKRFRRCCKTERGNVSVSVFHHVVQSQPGNTCRRIMEARVELHHIHPKCGVLVWRVSSTMHQLKPKYCHLCPPFLVDPNMLESARCTQEKRQTNLCNLTIFFEVWHQ